MKGEGLSYEKFMRSLRPEKDFSRYMLGSVLVLSKPMWGIEPPVMYAYLKDVTRHLLGAGPLPQPPKGANVEETSVSEGLATQRTLWTPGGDVHV